MKTEQVILVNEQDEQTGFMEKIQAHREAKLHRAFSVFVFNTKGELLLQQRAAHKYHSGGLWTNTCCSHPRQGERTETAAHRRLKEEMGLTCELQHKFSFIYKAELDHGLTEHELDHIFVGVTDLVPQPDPEEVANYKYVSPDRLKQDINNDPGQYTVWFRLIYDRVKKSIT